MFALVALARTDAWATRRYWLAQYRHIKEEHQDKLRRDLAVYRQHREQSRGGGGRFRLGPDDTPPP